MLHLDLLDFFRGRYSWRKLLRLIPQLPWDSRYKLAIADDDELAGQALTDGGSRAPIPLTEWSELRDLRAAVLDALASLERTVIGVNTPRGKRLPQFKAQPRPETAAARLHRRRRDQAMEELEAQITGTS